MAVRKTWRNVVLATAVCALVALIWRGYIIISPRTDTDSDTPLALLSMKQDKPDSVQVSSKIVDDGPPHETETASATNSSSSSIVAERSHDKAGHKATGGRVALFKASSFPTGRPLQVEHSARQKAVIEACKHAWSGYKKYAWGRDELMPVTKQWVDDFKMGLTILDSLDTLWLLGLEAEFAEARQWVAEELVFSKSSSVSVFETTIRALGGLLSAYHLSNDDVFLKKATELGDALKPAFTSQSGLPYPRVNLQSRRAIISHETSIAEAGSLQLEFRDLSRSTGDSSYQEAADQAMDVLLSFDKALLPEYVSMTNPGLQAGSLGIGARTDSFYEYLLKQWLQSGNTENKFLKRHLSMVSAVNETLIGYSFPSHLPFAGRWRGVLEPDMEHLACFYPGLLALGVSQGLHPGQARLAKGLGESCYQMYRHTRTGLAGEISMFNTDSRIKEDLSVAVSGYNLRPETVESLFLLYRWTGDEQYREWAWQIFQAIEQHCRVSTGGYSSLGSTPPDLKDKMETFYLAETLKYLFLLFSEDTSLLSLDEWVFNTEAHPLPVWNTA